MRASDRAWLQLAAGVAIWDATCPRGETLSSGAHRHMHSHRWLTTTLIVYLSGHLMGVWPRRYDPLAALGRLRSDWPRDEKDPHLTRWGSFVVSSDTRQPSHSRSMPM